MAQPQVPGESGPPVAVGAARSTETAPRDVYPSIVEPRTDGSQRYIVYADAPEGLGAEDVSTCWLSVDLESVVARELWR